MSLYNKTGMGDRHSLFGGAVSPLFYDFHIKSQDKTIGVYESKVQGKYESTGLCREGHGLLLVQ